MGRGWGKWTSQCDLSATRHPQLAALRLPARLGKAAQSGVWGGGPDGSDAGLTAGAATARACCRFQVEVRDAARTAEIFCVCAKARLVRKATHATGQRANADHARLPRTPPLGVIRA